MILAMALLVLSANGVAGNKVIYGDDNRKDLYAVDNNLHLELARSTAAMISTSLVVKQDDGNYKLEGATLKDRGICADARFADQLTAASCSGFLVGPDLLVTAGHCVRDNFSCDGSKWVFDYGINHESDDTEEIIVSEASVYECKEIIERQLSRTDSNDFTLIRLDRVVTDRRPLSFRTEGRIEKKAAVVVIGHPTGLPVKVADGAWVRNSRNDIFFTTNLDTFGGNSGSAVFNATTGEVEGILVRGETDYVFNKDKGCREPYKCTNEGCRGEDVTRITNIQYLMEMSH